MIRIISTLIISLFLFPKVVLAAPLVNISSFPANITAGQEFDVSFEVSGADPSSNYYMKALGGEGLNEVDTWNGSWYQQNASWLSMPVFTTNAEASASASIKARFDSETQGGAKQFLIRVRKDGTETNYDSLAVAISVTVATPTPTPVPTQAPTASLTPTATPTKIPTPTPTKSPTPKPTKTPTPEATDASTEVLGLNVDESPTPTEVAEGNVKKKNIPFLPIIFIGSGVLMVGFAVYNLVRARKNPTPT